jgi:NADP-dependent 3-hydroxy acid dehydrogenase YdfG
MNSLGYFTITGEDSQAFARASGDYNPLHLDSVVARRTRFGQTLIHGVHGTLKALDLLLERRRARTELLSIKVKFSRPAAQDQQFEVFCNTPGAITRLEVFAGGKRCQVIEVELVDSTYENQVRPDRIRDIGGDANTCADLSIASCQDLQGEVELVWDDEIVCSMFPSIFNYIPHLQIAVLLATTRIVGMRCPGLHSVFAQLNLKFLRLPASTTTDCRKVLAYRVLHCDPRIDRVELSLNGDCVQGSIEAFFRSPLIMQADFAHLASLVTDNEFEHQRALVLGASRGLGEIITKLLAAGGAEVVMTYAVGKEDASRISKEIGRHRPSPAVLAYNVLNSSPDDDFNRLCKSITHIYYLASPLISKSENAHWDTGLFAHYCRFYIDGLAALLQNIDRIRDKNQELRVFIPSSIFLEKDTKGFDEYIAAKAAAEAFMRSYQNSHRYCSTHAPRLPQLRTDQTAGVKTVNEQQTIEVILSHLRIVSGKAFTIDEPG